MFYRYYNKGATIAVPYESAIFAVVMLLFINVFSLLILFFPNITEIVFTGHTRIELFVYVIIGATVGYIMLANLIRKNEILSVKDYPKNVKLHSWSLFFYIVISFVFLMFIIVKRRS